MMRQVKHALRYRRSVFVCMIGLLLLGSRCPYSVVARADDAVAKKNEKTVTAAIDISPKGQPPGARKKGEQPTYYVWQIGDVWHVVTKTKTQKHEFKGIVTVHGGKITKIGDFGGMEAGGKKKNGKKKRAEDLGRWNAERNRIDFKFITNGGDDGFSFTVDRKVDQLTFDLKIDDKYQAKHVKIGINEKSPTEVPFALATSPDTDKSSTETPLTESPAENDSSETESDDAKDK